MGKLPLYYIEKELKEKKCLCKTRRILMCGSMDLNECKLKTENFSKQRCVCLIKILRLPLNLINILSFSVY